LRTSATEITAIVASTTISAAPISVSATPIASEIGPMTATPTGISAKEPSTSYELTRESFSSGMCCWSVVSQKTP